MKWAHFFLLLFLVPNLIYARLHQEDCANIYNQALGEENRCIAFIKQLNKFGSAPAETRAQILNYAITSCQQAISHYDTILNDIAKQSKKYRHEPWCIKMKEDCTNNKNKILSTLSTLQNELNKTLSTITFIKANNLFHESQKIADLASAKSQECLTHLDNIEELIATLNETATLYEEAASTVREALALISSSSDETGKAFLQQAIDAYEEAARQHREKAAELQVDMLPKF